NLAASLYCPCSPEIPGRGVNALPGLPPRRRLETRSPGKRSATGENGLMLTVTLGMILCVIGSRKFGS
ncbi:hypothetical protein, partial [Klebsiella michiganensis]|uniref:hypothetical protein n=3 Tax=Klebsiella TaxID=570 RepID=UPI0013E9F311